MITARTSGEGAVKHFGPVHLLRQPRLSDYIELRLPNKSDYDRVFEFKNALHGEGLTFFGSSQRFGAEKWVDWAVDASAERKAAISVASIGNRIAGVSEVTQQYYGEGILVMAVAQWARRQGVGDALMSDVLQKSRNLFPRVLLYVNFSNDAAQALYHKHGFRQCIGDDGPYLKMELVLPSGTTSKATNP